MDRSAKDYGLNLLGSYMACIRDRRSNEPTRLIAEEDAQGMINRLVPA